MANESPEKKGYGPYPNVHDYSRHQPAQRIAKDHGDYNRYRQLQVHKAMAGDAPHHPMITRDDPPEYSTNPYQILVQPIGRRPVESRLSQSSSGSSQDPEVEIPHLRIVVAVECLAGLLSVICAALLVPFGATHSDIIHSVSFMFGLLYMTTGIATALCFKWRSTTSMKICLSVNVLGSILALAAVIIGILSMFETFPGKGAEERFDLGDEQHNAVTHVLTATAIMAAIIELGSSVYIVYRIIRCWRLRADERSLPVSL